MSELATRVARLEALQEIGQLPARYARAVDSRDIDTLVDLFVSNVRVTKETSGSPALRELFEHLLRTFTTSVHFVPNHIIDLDENDPDHARGLVYCRAEHEVGDAWIVMAITYTDDYRREAVDGASNGASSEPGTPSISSTARWVPASCAGIHGAR